VLFTSESICSTIDQAVRRKWRPAVVARTPPLNRSKTIKPSECSSWLMQRLSVDCRSGITSAAPKAAVIRCCQSVSKMLQIDGGRVRVRPSFLWDLCSLTILATN
jgi:hypothetical protein